MAEQYPSQEIEIKWQKAWEERGIHRAVEIPGAHKYYVLEMLPYPSGRLHMGHVRNYSIGDALARFKKMNGYNVLHPIGWDSFGLPAENAAIKNNIHPEKWTLDNISFMRTQMKRLGFSYDWSREVATCQPEYYRWNQWFFLKMLEKGLVYKKFATVNWCNECQTVLANEQVVNGGCWRDGSLIVQKKLEQWFIKITDYAAELHQQIERLSEWPERVRLMQNNWIGRSLGANVFFQVADSNLTIEVFTTRIDTIYGSSAILLSPEHQLVDKLIEASPQKEVFRQFLDELLRKTKQDRSFVDTTKEGIFLGRYALNPFNGEKIPIWIANFILMEYGTGAIMAVPGHDARDHEFALKYKLPIPTVVKPISDEIKNGELFEEYGISVNSGPYSGLPTQEAIRQMVADAEKGGFGKATVSFKIRDWGISRQRYWGTPIPVVYCRSCGMVPVPENQLPVRLPPLEKIDYRGGSPLENIPEFVNTHCPRCQGPARRDTDTMDTFIDSSWYFLRYTDAQISCSPIDKKKLQYWFPVDIYIGGIEHAVGHLIYARFWWKMMRDMGLLNGDEPIYRLLTQGMVIKDGAKMSKSLGNIVDPDYLIERYGADTSRLFILFASPPEKDLDWSDQGIEGCYRFVNRVYRLVEKHLGWMADFKASIPPSDLCSPRQLKIMRKTHQTIDKVTSDIEERLRFNTAIAACMELVNELYLMDIDGISEPVDRAVFKHSVESLLLLLSPFVPHLCEELWSSTGHPDLILESSWPKPDPAFLAEELVEIPVMVNGKLRTRIQVPIEASQEQVQSLALSQPKIAELLTKQKPAKCVYVKHKVINLVIK